MNALPPAAHVRRDQVHWASAEDLGLSRASTSMNPLDTFTQGLVSDYHAARGLVMPHPKVTRGTARATSSLAEERVAHLVTAHFADIDHIFIDQAMAIPGERRQPRPDLIATVGSEIRLLIDVKMDLGRKRTELPAMATEAARLLRVHTGSEVTLTVRDHDGAASKAAHRWRLSERCQYVFLILSGMNIRKDMLGESLAGVAAEARTVQWASGQDRLHALVLWPRHHPNDPAFKSVDHAARELRGGLNANHVERLFNILDETLGPSSH